MHRTPVLVTMHGWLPPPPARVIVKAFWDFAQRADDKAKKSAERLVKVWEERRVFSAAHAKQLREAIKTAPAAAPAAAAGAAGPQPPSAMASSDLKKLQVLDEASMALFLHAVPVPVSGFGSYLAGEGGRGLAACGVVTLHRAPRTLIFLRHREKVSHVLLAALHSPIFLPSGLRKGA